MPFPNENVALPNIFVQRLIAPGRDPRRPRRYSRLARLVAMTAVSLTLTCCSQKVTPYNSDVAKSIQSLLKKVDIIYFETLRAERSAGTNPTAQAAAARQAVSSADFVKDWNDTLSDADVLKATLCSTPNNDDECKIATGFVSDLVAFEGSVALSGASVTTTTISLGQMQDRLLTLLHAEIINKTPPPPAGQVWVSSVKASV
jgi:hypothetical protein